MPAPDGAAALPSPKAKEAIQPRRQPAYNVVLLDDNDHSFPYVVEMLSRLFGHSRQRAWHLARQVDSLGRAVIDTTTLERAELKQMQIHEYGPDWRVDRPRGSMSALIEPVSD